MKEEEFFGSRKKIWIVRLGLIIVFSSVIFADNVIFNQWGIFSQLSIVGIVLTGATTYLTTIFNSPL